MVQISQKLGNMNENWVHLKESFVAVFEVTISAISKNFKVPNLLADLILS